MTVVALLAVADPLTGSGTPAWADLDGHPLVWHAVRRLQDAGVDRIVLVADPTHAARAAQIADTGTVDVVISGGDTGLRAGFADALADGSDVVLVHDPTRAFAPVAMIRRVIDAVRTGAVVVVPVLPVVDTIRAAGTDGRASALVDRDRLRIVQTPQGFAAAALRRRHERPSDGVRDAGGLRTRAGDPPATGFVDEAAAAAAAGEPLTTVPGHADAIRVLTPGDLDQARRSLGPVGPLLPDAHRHERQTDVRG